MKRIFGTYTFVFIFFAFLLQGCGISASSPLEQNKTSINNAGLEYLTITNTEYVNGQNPDDGMVMQIYTYDIQTKTLSKMDGIPYTSQYPLSVVSLSDNKIYYTAAVGKVKGQYLSGGDQLFSYDLISKTIEQLSDDIFAINHIVPCGDSLVLAAVRKGKRALQTVFYDKKTKEFNYIDNNDDDLHTWAVSYNPDIDKIYIVQYSDSEEWERLDEANRTQTLPIPPINSIIEVDNTTKKLKNIIDLEKEVIFTLSARGNQVFLVTSPSIMDGSIEYSLVNVDTGERHKIDLPIHTKACYLTKNMQGLYFLGGGIDANKERGIYYYDFETMEIEEIFLQKSGFINNFMLLTCN